MIIIFVEFIDQLIDYPINRASLSFSSLFLHDQTWYNLPISYNILEKKNIHYFNETLQRWNCQSPVDTVNITRRSHNQLSVSPPQAIL